MSLLNQYQIPLAIFIICVFVAVYSILKWLFRMPLIPKFIFLSLVVCTGGAGGVDLEYFPGNGTSDKPGHFKIKFDSLGWPHAALGSVAMIALAHCQEREQCGDQPDTSKPSYIRAIFTPPYDWARRRYLAYFEGGACSKDVIKSAAGIEEA